MLEVRAATRANLHHSAAQPREQLVAMRGASAAFAHLSDPRVDASEHRMRGMFDHRSQASLADSVLRA